MPHDERLLLLSLDGQQDLVTHLAHPALIIDMDAPRRAMVWGVPQGTVVHHTHTRHLLNRAEGPGGADGKEESLRAAPPLPGCKPLEGRARESARR